MHAYMRYLIAVLFLAAIATAADPPAAPVPTLTDKQRLELAQLQHQADQLQVQMATLNAEYIQLQAKAQTLQAQFTQLSPKEQDLRKQIEIKKTDLLKSAGADPEKYVIDPESLAIVLRDSGGPGSKATAAEVKRMAEEAAKNKK